MKLSKTEIEKISKFVLRQIHLAGATVVDEEKAKGTIVNIINENMEEERRIEDEALKLLKKHGGTAAAGLDQGKAFQMIKKQLANQRKFVI